MYIQIIELPCKNMVKKNQVTILKRAKKNLKLKVSKSLVISIHLKVNFRISKS